MDMVAHDAESIELETIFGLTLANRIKQNFAALQPGEPKFAIVAADGDVVTTSNLKIAG